MLLICWLALFSNSTKADLLSATVNYHQAKYNLAFEQFEQLVKLGNKDAIYNIAVMYLHGQGVDKNIIKAHSWFLLAADYGLADASEHASLIAAQITDKKLLESNYKTLTQVHSYKVFSKQLLPVFDATQKNQQIPIREYTVDAQYPEQAYEKGLEGWVWLEFDIDASGAVKDIEILDAYPNKTFNRAITNAVHRWKYKPYVENGKAQTFYNRSLLYHFTTYKGKRYKQSFAKQQKQYQKKINKLIEQAEQGNSLVQYYIANWLSADEHNATRLLKYHWHQENAGSDLLLKSASNGFSNSQYRLGANLLRGEQTEQDRRKGLNWILLAAQSGFAPAQYRLGRELLNHQHIEYDEEKAIAWLNTASEQGYFRAIRDLTTLHLVKNNNSQYVATLVDQGLEIDGAHPELLLNQAKLLLLKKDTKSAKKIALSALDSALSRGFSPIQIQKFISKL
ncbi:energy transducer TonB [Pseudoalteromonas sp. NBT06-2]|uniref:TonB family protein n=1 Tax=Pseudoalteromonas sp. NBT06-2 TaxID=2025950 RepID=UPI000BA4F093|nr:TonB family protein [Pseudoalteromonas sp. NBT06-2]PAJ72463.1 energy transducer TonB [Pseudoalteromonas sp. NBT06-2]